jgi:hypothetical protein
VDNGKSAWAVILDGPPPRRLGVCVSVCLRSLYCVFMGANVIVSMDMLYRGSSTPFLIFLI